MIYASKFTNSPPFINVKINLLYAQFFFYFMEKSVLLEAVFIRRFLQSFDMCQQDSSNKSTTYTTVIICRYEPHKAAAKFNPGQLVPYTTYLKAFPQKVTHKNTIIHILLTGLGDWFIHHKNKFCFP